ncbi:hypothetical protein RRG08_032882, partial [Elysia crispata]
MRASVTDEVDDVKDGDVCDEVDDVENGNVCDEVEDVENATGQQFNELHKYNTNHLCSTVSCLDVTGGPKIAVNEYKGT